MSEGRTNKGYGQDLLEGLSPSISIPQIGAIFKDTTQGLAAKLTEEIINVCKIPELDNIIITPRIAKNNVGVAELVATAYFNTQNPSGNIYYRGNGKGKTRNNGQPNILVPLGLINSGSTGAGPFGTTEQFRAMIKPLCKVNERNEAIMNFKTVPGANNLAQIELDFNALLCLGLGIKPDDQYDFAIWSVQPINGTNNFSIVIMKTIINNGSRKGRNSSFNYSRIEQEQFRRLNNNNNNGNNGGRNY